MAYNFMRAHRDQPFLLPPDLRDWLPTGHLAWFILDVDDQPDLAPFSRQHRDHRHGHPPAATLSCGASSERTPRSTTHPSTGSTATMGTGTPVTTPRPGSACCSMAIASA